MAFLSQFKSSLHFFFQYTLHHNTRY